MNQLYHLKKERNKTINIKVRVSKNQVGLLKLYYQSPEIAPQWIKFATCTLEDNIEQTIMLYYGNRGELTLIE